MQRCMQAYVPCQNQEHFPKVNAPALQIKVKFTLRQRSNSQETAKKATHRAQKNLLPSAWSKEAILGMM